MNRREFLKNAILLASLTPIVRLSASPSSSPSAVSSSKVTRRPFGSGGITLPLLGYGMMRLPRNGGEIDAAAAEKLVDRAMAAGVNYFDTADPYHGGKSEIFVGNALRKYPRSSYFIADKLPIWKIRTLRDAERLFEAQLKKCRTTYFDFYLLHALNISRWKTVERLKLYDFAERMRKAGKIRHIGFSFHDSPNLLRTIANAHPWDFMQLQINYQDWYDQNARAQYEIATERKIPVIVMEPLKGGSLASLNPAASAILRTANPRVSSASWAIRYAASLPNVVCVLSGMTKPEHLEDNLRTMTPFRPLVPRERMTLDSALAAIRKTDSVPCTVCEYCLPCPVGVAIPRIFGAFNRWKAGGDAETFRNAINAMSEDEKPSACVKCGACLTKCPQKINIPAQLRRVAEESRKRV